MEAVLIIFVLLFGALLLFALIGVLIYNGLVRLRNKVDESWSGIDVQLKKRHDLVPNLVNTVKGYATHERETLDMVIKARTMATSAHTVAEASMAEGVLGGMLGKVFALAEAYPDLKANTNFLELQRQLADLEDNISAARRIYNGNVQLYNTKIQTIPNNLIAGPAGFTARNFFEIQDPGEREVVQVQF